MSNCPPPATHLPTRQTWLAAHALPQPPQLTRSFSTSMHEVPHRLGRAQMRSGEALGARVQSRAESLSGAKRLRTSDWLVAMVGFCVLPPTQVVPVGGGTFELPARMKSTPLAPGLSRRSAKSVVRIGTVAAERKPASTFPGPKMAKPWGATVNEGNASEPEPPSPRVYCSE